MSGRAWFVVGLAATALSCGGSDPGASRLKVPPAPTKTEVIGIVPVGEVPARVLAATGEIWRLACKARRLEAKEAVKLAVLPPSEMVEMVRRHVKAEIPADVIRGEGRCYATLGLVPADYDYEAETYALLEEELAGLYIPEDKTMYVSRDVEDDDLESTLAHELVHALQDQHFQIGARLKYVPSATSQLAAMHAMAEGDATSAMLDEMILAQGGEEALLAKNASTAPDLDPDDMLRTSAGGKRKGGRIAKTPRFIALGLLAPYADGLRFVNALRRRGGWKQVDKAWARPPSTSEQLLHLAKYDLNEPAIDVPVPTAKALGTGWTKTYDDVLGEADGRLAFRVWMETGPSNDSAAGWGGDRLVLYEASGDRRAAAWRIVFDTNADAVEAWAHLLKGLTKMRGAPTQTGSTGVDFALFGGPPPPPPPPPPVEDKTPKGTPKKPAPPPLPPLPQLPDAPGTKPKAPAGCFAVRHSGTAVSVVSAPCGVIAAWSEEVGKSP